MKATFLFLSLISFGAWAAPATVEVYPGPGVDTYQSHLYTVEVQRGANWLSSYVYSYSRPSDSLWHWGTSPSVNFTTFGTNSSATVRISKPGAYITSVDVSPKNSNLLALITNGQALITLKQGDKAWITINGDDGNPLFVFAGSPKPTVPKGATYFGPGIRDLAPSTGNHYTASNNETIYVDGGAWLRGSFDVRGKSNVKIMGPGVLSGDLWTSEMVQSLAPADQLAYVMIRGDWGGTNATVQGLTIVDSPFYNFYAGTHQVTDVKLLSPWYYSTDGFQGVNSVDQSFAFVGDNVFFPIWAGIANDNITVTNSFAGTTGNAVFCGGYWGNPANYRYKATVNNVDIKTYNSDAWVQFGAPLTPALVQIWMDNNNSTYGYSNQTYQNIRVEGDLAVPLAMLQNLSYPWSPPNPSLPPRGNSYNLVFSNITVTGSQKTLSKIQGLDAQNGFHNVSFQNLRIAGTSVTQSNFANYFAVNAYVTGLTFTTSTH